MSLRREEIGAIPEDTVRVAKASFPKGNRYMRLRDEFGTIFTDSEFADLFASQGQPAEAPWRLALVCLVQYLEELTDRQAADAVRARMDLKYLLGLDLTDPGFDFSVLSEFRQRLIEHDAEHRLFSLLVAKLSERGYIKKRGIQRTDSTHVLAAVRLFHRAELLGETLRAALNEIATLEPEWLRAWVPQEWFERYSRRVELWRLGIAKTEKDAFMEQIGRDGSQLLSALYEQQAPAHLAQLPTVQLLRQVWVQQFYWEDGALRLRNKDALPSSHLTIRSPYDPQAQFGQKRDLTWYGYKVHFTETCDADLPHLITCVQTADATTTDMQQTQQVHAELEQRELLPQTHLVDEGYVDAGAILQSRERYAIVLLGPVSRNNQWQAKAGRGYDRSGFSIDWQAQEATCPQGHKSVYWRERTDQHGHPNISIRFDRHTCLQCPARSDCTRSPDAPRLLTIRSKEEFLQLQEARLQQETSEFHVAYAARSGIEGTHSQGVRALGLRRARYIGLDKTRLQHFLTAAAINCIRIDDFLAGAKTAKTRTSRFAALAPERVA
jgi:transposase